MPVDILFLTDAGTYGLTAISSVFKDKSIYNIQKIYEMAGFFMFQIDKEKTIKKAIAKYNDIYPVRGKHSLEECFFCLRGEYHLVFRTRDQKVRVMKAYEKQVSIAFGTESHKTFNSIFKILNKPIIVRSYIIKRPVRTRLINLFPIPGITWSDNIDDDSVTINRPGVEQSRSSSCNTGNRVTSDPAIKTLYASMEQNYPVSAFPEPVYQLRNTRSQPAHTPTSYRIEVLESGMLPLTIDREDFLQS